jgi:hypothetical protein
MAIKFRLRGLAETFLERIDCPCCGYSGTDDSGFSAELTRVSFQGIIVVAQCRQCSEIFVPERQRLGIINPNALKLAVEKDSRDTGEPLFPTYESVRLNAERLNAQRKGGVH